MTSKPKLSRQVRVPTPARCVNRDRWAQCYNKSAMKKKLLLIPFIIITFNCLGQTDKALIQLNDSITLSLEREPFELNNKTINFQNNIPIGIDKKLLLGTDGRIPEYKLTKAILNINNSRINLQIDDMYNPWFEEKFNRELVKLHNEKNRLKLKVIFSDGAGTYLAEWLIIDNISIRTILSPDENVLIENFYN